MAQIRTKRNYWSGLGGLVSRDKRGEDMEDRLDFDDYVAARWQVLVRSSMLLGCSQADGEDLVQTALLRCYRAWDKVTAARDQDAYVYRVLLNCLSKSRSRKWSGERPAGDELPDSAFTSDHAESVATSQLLRTTLMTLPSVQRSVLVLRYFADLTEARVAEVLDVPVGTVKSRSARGLAQLNAILDESTRHYDGAGKVNDD
jgi:RNA polymerase sigma-70 factor (sigma-E family)